MDKKNLTMVYILQYFTTFAIDFRLHNDGISTRLIVYVRELQNDN